MEKGKWEVERRKRIVERRKKLGVEGAFDGKSAALKDVGVNHGSFYVLVTE